jgi:hypothetical protein
MARPGGSFLLAQAAGILVADFPHADTVVLTRLQVLVFIEHGTAPSAMRDIRLIETAVQTVRAWPGWQRVRS